MNTTIHETFGNALNSLSYKKAVTIVKSQEFSLCIHQIVHSRGKWAAYSDTQEHHRQEKYTMTLNQVPQNLWHWFNVGSLGTNTAHTCWKSDRDHLSTNFLSIISKVLSKTIPVARIKTASTCHTQRQRHCSDVRRLEQHRKMSPPVSDGLHGFFQEKIGQQPTQSCRRCLWNWYQQVCWHEEWLPTYL